MPELVKNAVWSVKEEAYNERTALASVRCEKLTVEDEVDTGELLPCLDEDTRESTEGDLVVAGAEAVGVRALTVALLLFEVGTDILQLELDFSVGRLETGEAAQGVNGIGIATLLDQETGRLAKANVK